MNPLKLLALVLLAVFACTPPTSSDAGAGADPTTLDVAPPIEPSGPSPQELPFSRKLRASTFVPATPDTRSQAQIDVAACTAADGSWRCQGKKPVTFMAGASTPITPAAWTIQNWFVDNSNVSGTASDQNSCTSSAAPCLTWAEISVHRLGPNPIWSQSTVPTLTITIMSNDQAEIIDLIGQAQGSVVGFQCALGTAVATGTLAGVTVANRSTPTLTKATLGAAVAANQLVVNSTHSSRAFTYKSLGANAWSLTQPLAPITFSAPNASPAEVNTWANTDSYSVFAPAKVRFGTLNLVATDFNAGFNAPMVINSCDITGASAVRPIELRSSWYKISESLLEQAISPAVAAETLNSGFTNVVVTANGSISGHLGSTRTTTFVGGSINASVVMVNTGFDGDVLLNASTTDITYGYTGTYGTVFIDTGGTLILSGSGDMVGSSAYGGGTPIVWGGGSLQVQSNVRVTYPSGAGAAAAAFLQTGGFTVDSSTACWLETAAGGVTTGKTLTAAHLDADLGATLGAYCRPGGACVTNDVF